LKVFNFSKVWNTIRFPKIQNPKIWFSNSRKFTKKMNILKYHKAIFQILCFLCWRLHMNKIKFRKLNCTRHTLISKNRGACMKTWNGSSHETQLAPKGRSLDGDGDSATAPVSAIPHSHCNRNCSWRTDSSCHARKAVDRYALSELVLLQYVSLVFS
jgi:hypothetical protein